MIRSLRGRVLLGAVLWTIGLFLLSMAAIGQVMRHFPDMPFLGQRGSIHLWAFRAAPLTMIAVPFMIVGVLSVRSGLSGFARLRARLSAVHDGREARVEGRYATEVQPL